MKNTPPLTRRAVKGASHLLDVGNLYTRAQLRKFLSTSDATIMTGVFRPTGYRSVFLFVTEHKTSDRTQFMDRLDGDILRWQGQLSGRTDALIFEHRKRDLELLLFYRHDRYEYPEAAFRYEGVFRYLRRRGAHPTSFVLARESKRDALETAQDLAATKKVFDPEDEQDARKRALSSIVSRRGQPRFRIELLRAYRGRCAITRCDCAEALEAAHIYPYKGSHTNDVTNGLLLRADLHTLFDLGWVTVHPRTYTVAIHPVLRSTTYGCLDGRRLALPRRSADYPSKKALLWHMKNSRAHKGKPE